MGRRGVIAAAVVVTVVAVVGYLALRETSPPAELIGAPPQPLSPADAAGAGVSLAVQTDDPGIAQLGARWYFNWDVVPHDGLDLPFVPLVCGYPGDRQVSEAQLQEVEDTIRGDPGSYPDGTLFLLGNEIGYRHQNDGRTPRQYAQDFQRCSTLLTTINPSFLVAVGPAILTPDDSITSAIVDAEDGLDYLDQVISEYQDLYGGPIPADYFAATNHVLRADQAQLDVFEERLVELRTLLADRGFRDRSVVLTEFGVPTRGSSAAEIEWFLQEATRIVATAVDPEVGHPDDDKLVQRYAWFMARPLSMLDKLRSLGAGAFFLQLAQTSLYDADGSPTHLGRAYGAMIGDTS